MMMIILQRFLWISVVISGVAVQGDLMKEKTQTRLERRMVGHDVSFHWMYPLLDSSWKVLFSPNGNTMIIWRRQSAPSVYGKRVSLLSDGVMLKNLSKSDEGLYRTEEQTMIVNNTVLFVHTEGELRPRIFADGILLTSANRLRKIPQTIMIIAQQDLKADITIHFNHGKNVSCFSAYMCSCDVANIPELCIDTYDISVEVEYGFYVTQVNIQVTVDDPDGVTNAAGMCFTWWLLHMMSVLFHNLI